MAEPKQLGAVMRVLLIDDRHLLRAGLRAILESQLKLSVVAEGKIRETSALISATRPEFILFGFASHAESIHTMTQLRKLAHSPTTLVIADNISETGARQLLTLGTSGILLQESASQHLSWAITAASRGGCALSPEISRKIIKEYTSPVIGGTRKRVAQEKIYTLTTREREVLDLVSEGLSNQSIALALIISAETVKDHVRSICSKLGVERRFHAARIAWQANEYRIPA